MIRCVHIVGIRELSSSRGLHYTEFPSSTVVTSENCKQLAILQQLLNPDHFGHHTVTVLQILLFAFFVLKGCSTVQEIEIENTNIDYSRLLPEKNRLGLCRFFT